MKMLVENTSSCARSTVPCSIFHCDIMLQLCVEVDSGAVLHDVATACRSGVVGDRCWWILACTDRGAGEGKDAAGSEGRGERAGSGKSLVFVLGSERCVRAILGHALGRVARLTQVFWSWVWGLLA